MPESIFEIYIATWRKGKGFDRSKRKGLAKADAEKNSDGSRDTGKQKNSAKNDPKKGD